MVSHEEALAMSEKFRTPEINGTTTSMIIEQYHLADFARRHGVRVETVIPLHHGTREQEAAGYRHLTGDQKRDPELVAACEAMLEIDYPAEYRRFLAGWSRIQDRRGAGAAVY